MVECLLHVLSTKAYLEYHPFSAGKTTWKWRMTRNLRYSCLGFVSTMFPACCLFCGLYGQRAKVKEYTPRKESRTPREESRGWCGGCSWFWWKIDCPYCGACSDAFLDLSFWGFQRVCHFCVRKAYFLASSAPCFYPVFGPWLRCVCKTRLSPAGSAEQNFGHRWPKAFEGSNRAGAAAAAHIWVTKNLAVEFLQALLPPLHIIYMDHNDKIEQHIHFENHYQLSSIYNESNQAFFTLHLMTSVLGWLLAPKRNPSVSVSFWDASYQAMRVKKALVVWVIEGNIRIHYLK